MRSLNFYMIMFSLLFISIENNAQVFTKSGVLKMSLKNSGTIINGNQVNGYYFFYNQEKKSAKLNNYLLTVVDENLREVNSITITRSNTIQLIEGAYNGAAFCFLFYDLKSRSTELLSFDGTLKQTASVIKKISSKLLISAYTQIAQGKEATQNYLLPIDNKGFLCYSLKEGKKFHYEIEYYDNSLKRVWVDRAPDTAKIETATEAFQDKEYVGSLIMKKENQASSNLEYHHMVHQIESGKKLFSVPVKTDQYTVAISNVHYDSLSRNFVVFGEYYGKSDRELKDQSLGFITVVYDMEGKMINQKANSWANEISKAAPFTEKGKFEGLNANVLFHQTIRTADGQIFIVGEQYKKAISGAGVALKVLSIAAAAATGYYRSSTSAIQLNIYNMIVFQFNPDYTINKVHLFEKSKNVVMLPEGWGTISPKLLSFYAKSIGGFDYSFSQLSADKTTFIVNYINFDRSPNAKSKNILGSIVYTPEKTFTVDKLELNRKSTEYFVSKAKNGYILITEYFRKEKRFESRLEKINY